MLVLDFSSNLWHGTTWKLVPQAYSTSNGEDKMKMASIIEQIANFMPEILHELLQEAENSEWTEEWFAEKIYQIIKLNLLTCDEVDSVFGWDSGQTKRFCEFFPEQENLKTWGLRGDWLGRARHQIFGLVSLIALKYQLKIEITFVPVVIPEVIESEQVVVDEKPELLPNWHIKLETCSWFEELTVRAQNGLRNAHCVTLGDLLQKNEAILLKRPNFGRRSLNEIIDALQLQGYTLNSVTHDEYLLHLEKVNKCGAVDVVEL